MAATIVDKQADYVLALKGNQSTPRTKVKEEVLNDRSGESNMPPLYPQGLANTH